MSLLSVDNLSITYGEDTVVDGLSFAIDRGEAVGIVGESGSGKSQTALALLGLLPEAATITGSISIDGTEVLGAAEAELDALRARRVAMVFQDPMQALNPYLRIGKQLRRILLQHGLATGAEADTRVVNMLRRVGLPDPEQQFRAYPHELSGGMRQRAMIASALIAGPGLLIADEPTTALDVTVQAQILELLEELRQDTALLLITHDLGIVAGRCDRMLVIEQGRLVESGSTSAVFAAPQHEHTAALLAAAPRLGRGRDLGAVAGDPVIDIDRAEVRYGRRVRAVRGLDLAVRTGETLAVVGESGSGKSSLVWAALGLVPLRSGTVTFCGATLPRTVEKRDLSTRRDLQLVFQDPVGSLNPQLRVAEIVGEPLVVHEKGMGAAARQKAVATILADAGLGVEYLDRYPHQLSGGQAQRVAIARALILKPKVLICDEAVAALDGSVREQILTLLRDVQHQTGLSIIFITHDLAVVREISHRVLVMYLGRMVELAGSHDLFEHPRHPYTQALMAAVPLPDPETPGGEATLAGEVPSVLAPPPGCAFHPRCPHAQAVCANELPVERQVDGVTVSCHRAEDIPAY